MRDRIEAFYGAYWAMRHKILVGPHVNDMGYEMARRIRLHKQYCTREKWFEGD
jgi:hypothetical protein